MPPSPTQTPPRYQIPPGPGYMPQGAPLARTGTGADLAVSEPPAELTVIGVLLEAFKEIAPELIVNGIATRTNFSQLGKLVSGATRAPLSFGMALLSGVVALVTKGQGSIGVPAVVVARGAAHATVSEISRPKEAEITSGVEPVSSGDSPPPTES